MDKLTNSLTQQQGEESNLPLLHRLSYILQWHFIVTAFSSLLYLTGCNTQKPLIDRYFVTHPTQANPFIIKDAKKTASSHEEVCISIPAGTALPADLTEKVTTTSPAISDRPEIPPFKPQDEFELPQGHQDWTAEKKQSYQKLQKMILEGQALQIEGRRNMIEGNGMITNGSKKVADGKNQVAEGSSLIGIAEKQLQYLLGKR